MAARCKRLGKYVNRVSMSVLAMVSTAAADGALGAGQNYVGRVVSESAAPRWPANPQAPKGAPNVIVILTDDTGFGETSTFGGPVPMTGMDTLAAQGLRYNQFNTTAICSPTRASLLTGREPHNVNMGMVTNHQAGFDGYNTVIPASAGTVADVLKQGGYNTAAFGKWHLAPEWEQSEGGPFSHWPTGMGFEYYYGFLGADTSMWSPSLVRNTTMVEPPHNDPTFYFEKSLADDAVAWIQRHRQVAPGKPYFIFYATGMVHTPHHAPKEWLEKFRGKFDMGWDALREQTFQRQKKLGVIPANAKLTPRPSVLPAWDSLSADQKKIAARLMEAHAAALAYTDFNIKRVISEARSGPDGDNTLIIYIAGDNGASAEGGAEGRLFEQSYINGYDESLAYQLSRIDEIGGPSLYNLNSAAWGWALTTPFQYYKQIASHFGGVRNGMVMSWPSRIKGSGIRSQFHHVSDIAPTIYEATGIAPPDTLNGVAQQPIDGVSMLYSFDHADTPSHRTQQVFEMSQNLGIYSNGWWAGTAPRDHPWTRGKDKGVGVDDPVTGRTWELYNITQDFSQAHNLAASNPAKLEQMKELFWAEAGRNHILPIHRNAAGLDTRPSLIAGKTSFVYHAGLTRVPELNAPPVLGRSFKITADVVVPDGAANGVLLTQGGRYGGYGLYMKAGQVKFHYNAVADRQYTVATSNPLAAGKHSIIAEFTRDNAKRGAGGTVTISIDGKKVATGRVENTLSTWISHTEGLDIGEDTLTPINEDYTIPTSRFTGIIGAVKVDLLD